LELLFFLWRSPPFVGLLLLLLLLWLLLLLLL